MNFEWIGKQEYATRFMFLPVKYQFTNKCVLGIKCTKNNCNVRVRQKKQAEFLMRPNIALAIHSLIQYHFLSGIFKNKWRNKMEMYQTKDEEEKNAHKFSEILVNRLIGSICKFKCAQSPCIMNPIRVRNHPCAHVCDCVCALRVRARLCVRCWFPLHSGYRYWPKHQVAETTTMPTQMIPASSFFYRGSRFFSTR